MRQVISWDDYFLNIAEAASLRSKDPKCQMGAVVVDNDNQIVATGYNDLPRGAVNSPDRFVKPNKFLFIEHAERNAFYAAARRGIALNGCKLYIHGPHFSCIDCARAIIQVGIVEVHMSAPDLTNPNFSFGAAHDLLVEAGIKLKMRKLTP